MKTILAFVASAVSLALQILRLRVRAAKTENDMEDARDDAAARLRDALAHGRIADVSAAKADHDALNAKLAGQRPANRNRKHNSPNRK